MQLCRTTHSVAPGCAGFKTPAVTQPIFLLSPAPRPCHQPAPSLMRPCIQSGHADTDNCKQPMDHHLSQAPSQHQHELGSPSTHPIDHTHPAASNLDTLAVQHIIPTLGQLELSSQQQPLDQPPDLQEQPQTEQHQPQSHSNAQPASQQSSKPHRKAKTGKQAGNAAAKLPYDFLLPRQLTTKPAADQDIAAAGVCFYAIHPKTLELQVLMVKQKNELTFPGGKRKAGEEARQVAAREVEEETHWQLKQEVVDGWLDESRTLYWSGGKYQLYFVHLPDMWDLPQRIQQQLESGQSHPEAIKVTGAQWIPHTLLTRGRSDTDTDSDSEPRMTHVAATIGQIKRRGFDLLWANLLKAAGLRLPPAVTKDPGADVGKGPKVGTTSSQARSRRSSSQEPTVEDHAKQGGSNAQKAASGAEPVPRIWPAGVQIDHVAAAPEVTLLRKPTRLS